MNPLDLARVKSDDVLRARIAYAGVLARTGCSTTQLVRSLRHEFGLSERQAFRVLRRARTQLQ